MTRGGGRPRYGFPPEARLRSRREFLVAQARGNFRRFSQHFIVYVRRRSDTSDHESAPTGARLGVTASKRVGNSVVRNRWKRIIREAFRHLRPDLGRIDVVVIGRAGNDPPALARAVSELRDTVRRWRRFDEKQRNRGRST